MKTTRFSWRLFFLRSILHWRWWLVVPYILLIGLPIALIITLGDMLNDWEKWERPLLWWKRHALRIGVNHD